MSKSRTCMCYMFVSKTILWVILMILLYIIDVNSQKYGLKYSQLLTVTKKQLIYITFVMVDKYLNHICYNFVKCSDDFNPNYMLHKY
jgi:hypothetical protein